MRLFLLAILFFFFFSASARASVITVCSSGCNALTVQGGINLASNWDEVRIIDSAEYNESIVINKSITLTSNTTVWPTIFKDTATVSQNTIVNITSRSSTLSFLNIKYNGTGQNIHGITLYQVNNATVKNVKSSATPISNNLGIYLFSSSNNFLSNVFASSSYYGIELFNSSVNTLSNSATTSNTFNGIILWSSSGNTLFNDTVTEGFYLFTNSYNNTLSNNTATSNTYGFRVYSNSYNNTLSNNTATSNIYGFYLENTYNNILSQNSVSGNSYGFYLSNASNNNFSNNFVSSNPNGFYLDLNSVNNSFSNNKVNSNGNGFTLFQSSYNIFSSNIVSSSSVYGIGILYSNNIVIRNNTVDNNALFNIFFCSSLNSNVKQNILSNSLGVVIGNYNGSISCSSESNNTEIENNTFINSNPYDIYLSNSTTGGNPVAFSINNVLNKSKINVNQKGTLYNQYYLDVLVQDNSLNPVNGASVNILDSGVFTSVNPTPGFNKTTDSQGRISQSILTEFMANSSLTDPSTFLYFNNYTINARKSGFFDLSYSTNISSSQFLTLNLIPNPTFLNSVCVNETGICWNSIQEAINNATNWQTVVIITPVEFDETITINKNITLTSNTSSFPTIFQSVNIIQGGSIINITAGSSIISRINVKYNGTGSSTNGITVFKSNNVTIDRVNVSVKPLPNNYGVYIIQSNQNLVKNSNLSGNYRGVYVANSPYVTLTNNLAKDNFDAGIYLDNSLYGTIILNQLNNTAKGISLSNSFNNYFEFNLVNSTDNPAVYLASSSSNDFNSDNISTNGVGSGHGVYILNSQNNVFRNEIINSTSLAGYGLLLDSSGSNLIYDSTINSTNTNDIFLQGVSSTANNFIINSTFNRSDIGVSSSSETTKLFVQNYLDLLVEALNSNPISSAVVEGKDIYEGTDLENPTPFFLTSTINTGYIPSQTLTEFMVDGSHSTNGYLYFTPYSLIIYQNSFQTNSTQVNLTSNEFQTVKLLDQPPGPPGLIWYDVPSLITINQSSTKIYRFILGNTANVTAQNILIKAKGISSTWYNFTPTFFSNLNSNSNGTLFMTFDIPLNASSQDYTVVINATNSISKFDNFILRVIGQSTQNYTRDQANQSLQIALAEIQLAKSQGKNVTDAEADYNTAFNYFINGNYNNAKIYADQAFNEAQNATQSTFNISMIYFIFAGLAVLILFISILGIRRRGPKTSKFEQLKEKWSENIKTKLR